MNIQVKQIGSLKTNTRIQIIDMTHSEIVLRDSPRGVSYERQGLDTRTFAYAERCPYTLAETIVSRTYTFNGKDAWDLSNETRL